MFKNEKNKCILITAVSMGLCFLGGYLIGRHSQDVHVIIGGFDEVISPEVRARFEGNGINSPHNIAKRMIEGWRKEHPGKKLFSDVNDEGVK
jgi:hypothetical protein